MISEARALPCPSRSWRLVPLVALAVLVALLATSSFAPPVAAASGSKVAIIVGPSGSRTAANRDQGLAAAAEAARHTSNVVTVFSPNATWTRVKRAITGASLVVYIGRGRGYPSRYSSSLRTTDEDGFGLNPVAGVNNRRTRFYGERYIRSTALAPNALVVLSRAAYASGSGDPGMAQPTLRVARRRVDNYGAGFLAAGASVVIADSSAAPRYYVRALFGATRTLDAVWRSAPSRHGHVTSFSSTRTPGATGRTDPVHPHAGFTRSIVGWLSTTTSMILSRGVVSLPPGSGPVVAVPSSIDATGSADASAALNAFIGTVPDGATIVFKAGGVYRMAGALKFAHRRNLTFEGNGSTLKGAGGTTESGSLIWLGSYGGANAGIAIRNFRLTGNSSTPGTYQAGREGAHGIMLDGGNGIEITNVTISAVWGDCLKLTTWADGVSFHDSTCASSGRNGITILAARNVAVQRVGFTRTGYCTFDIEPMSSSQGASNIRFLDNTAGTWSNSFLSADGAAGSVVNGLTVSGNTVTGKSLLTVIDLARRQNVVFTNNTSMVKAPGPVLRFAHIDGLTVTGNVQPLSSGPLASITDSTSVTYP